MITENELFELVGRLAADPGLRARLFANPAAVQAELGISLTDEQLAGLRATDLSPVAEGVDTRLSKSSMLSAFSVFSAEAVAPDASSIMGTAPDASSIMGTAPDASSIMGVAPDASSVMAVAPDTGATPDAYFFGSAETVAPDELELPPIEGVAPEARGPS